MPAFLHDPRLAVLPLHVEPARGERAAEDHALRVLADVDEPADADDLVAEAADVHVAVRVDFREREEREIETAAIVEVELRRLLDHRGEVLRAARIAACDGRTADQPLLVGEDHRVEQVFFRGDGRESRRNACAEIAHGMRIQLHRRAPHDHLARAERQRTNLRKRHAQFAGVARIVIGRVSLTLLRLDDDEVHENAGDLHLLGRQRAAPRHAFHLHDDDAARAPRRLRHREHFAEHGFLFHRDVAVFVGGGAAQQRDIDRERLEAQPFLAVDMHQLDEHLFRRRTLTRALLTRIDERAEPGLRDEAGTPARHFAHQLRP